jgi:predicted Zn-dependent protease
MTDRFTTVRPDGEPTADRWAGALHLFDGFGEQGAVTVREETPAEIWERAGLLFAEKQYIEAVPLLLGLVEEFPEHTSARLLLARAYYHSARLRRAEEQLRLLIDRDPVEPYAHLMLSRVLERQGRTAEAGPWRRMADAFSGEMSE